MKLLLENWQEFINEEIKTLSFEEVISLLRNNPDQRRSLDFDKGEGRKSWGGVYRENPKLVPFDYGEYPDLINAADNMGWDFIIADMSTVDDNNLLPVGHISYFDDKDLWDKHEHDGMPEYIGDNHKIILSKDGEISQKEKDSLNKYFGPMWQFKEPEWY
tara:strand:+ start:150 stop:629 length:480 start_codon:yes stop_codon:yes gene_type:complete